MTLARQFGEGEYYHLFNRGSSKSSIFRDDADRKRFLFSILYYQSPEKIENVSRFIKKYTPETGFPVKEALLERVLETRMVELVCFCLMPNHFHLLVREKEAGGISAYMQRVQLAHTNYMNAKHNLSGHMFQDRYKAAHVPDNHQLLYLSAYIHRNPRELKAWKGKEFEYPWSSLQDLTEGNRWGGLLEADIIAEQFEAEPNSNYADFVKTSTAKDFEKELGNTLLV